MVWLWMQAGLSRRVVSSAGECWGSGHTRCPQVAASVTKKLLVLGCFRCFTYKKCKTGLGIGRIEVCAHSCEIGTPASLEFPFVSTFPSLLNKRLILSPACCLPPFPAHSFIWDGKVNLGPPELLFSSFEPIVLLPCHLSCLGAAQ